MTDPIADMLTRIRNAIQSRKATVDVPRSNMKKQLAELLRAEGYLDGVTDDGKQGVLTLTLRWASDNTPAISGLRRVSKPGQRRYVGASEIPKVRNGLGVMFVSTSKGIMTDRQARKENVGGELICEVW